jgi:putative addiction module component (TIGR02574 family)
VDETIADNSCATYNDSMSSALVEAVKALPVEDRLQLIEEIWSTIEADDYPHATDGEIRLAEERLAEYRANPGAVVTLKEIKARFSNER